MNLIFETGFSSLFKNGEELCGDKVEIVKTDTCLIAVLSDGLGSGVKANILATLTTKIIVTMLRNGARLVDVLETVGNTLPICKVRNLAYSTFTVVQIDFEQEEATIIEFDNPGILFIHSGKIVPLMMKTRRIGEKEIRECRLKMREGDLLVAMSDGIVHAGAGGVYNFGWRWENVAKYMEKNYFNNHEENANSIACWLTEVCLNLYNDQPGDDATVLAIKARYPKTATIVVGPPEDPAKDNLISEELFSSPGKKIVCGGTTSKIIAREMKRELKVKIMDVSPETPPCGEIDGVDLVTEGVLTLSRAVEILKSSGSSEDICEQDGAAELAKILLNADNIRFIVGKALNPAYQNPDLPIDFGFKMRLVNSLKKILLAKGKQIQIDYY